MIRDYTFEAGVRNLEREIANICRKVARRVAESKSAPRHIAVQSLDKYLGPPRFLRDEMERADEIGLAIGIAWTEAGGDLLPVEVSLMDGKGSLMLTGQLGEVMQESAQAALSYARSHATDLGIRERRFRQARHPHPRARGGDPQGRPVGRDHHGHGADLGADPTARPPRRGHDRRDHPARPGAAHRRA